MNNNLTVKYALHQGVYWASYCGIYTYAVAYMINKGFEAATVGTILFISNFISFTLQPILADYADKMGSKILPKLMSIMATASIVCLGMVRFFDLPLFLFAALYILAALLLDMQVPLLNALSVHYTLRAWKINYGLGRGIGAFCYALASLGIGYVMEDFSVEWMPIITMSLTLIYTMLSISYPKDDSKIDKIEEKAEYVNLLQFFKKYKWYCISLFGIILIALVHVMTENYLIEILGQFGGNSSHVGKALFVATIAETPAMMLFGWVHKKLGTKKVLYTAGIFYVIRVTLLFLASSITAVYFIQILQVVTYTFLSPVQVNYANDCTDEADMVKGQSIITASYALGCAFGNLLGGILISASGVRALLIAAIAIAASGCAILFLCVNKALNAKTGL